VIKFRCRRCGQKIGVNDEGAGVIIACTNCEVQIVVPLGSDKEFQPSNAKDVIIDLPVFATNLQYPDSNVTEPPSPPNHGSASDHVIRSGVVSQLARLMMDKLFRATYTQRQQLIDSQRRATEQVMQMEARVEKIHQQFQWRLQAEERRTAELELELASKEAEFNELVRINKILATKAKNSDINSPKVQQNLADTTLLLRA